MNHLINKAKEKMNAQQLFFALLESPNTHSMFVKDHKTDPINSGLKRFIKDLHEFEGIHHEYDFEEVQKNINEGYFNGDMIMFQMDRLTDKYFRDGNH